VEEVRGVRLVVKLLAEGYSGEEVNGVLKLE
jgi:hypothetical protein